jgi:hypothetical protein
MAIHRVVVATWPDGLTLTVPLVGSSWIPRLLGHNAVTLFGTVRFRKAEHVLYAPTFLALLRHECTHARQEHERGGWRVIWQRIWQGAHGELEAAGKAAALGTVPTITF